MYRFQRGNVEVIGWTFRAKLKQQPQVAKYPFDEAEIQIQIWPKSLNKNIVLVPDLDEYQFTNPTQTPGLVESLVLEDWTVKRSFFGYRYNKYNATFGSSQVIKKFNIPDLSFNIDIRRNILSPMVAYAITLSVVMALMFAVMVIHAETSFNVLSYAAALFFVVAVTHVGLRSELNTHDVVYLEHGFIIMYLVLLSVSINSMIFYSSINVPIVQYQDNLIPKLLYWPALQGILLAITISVFYPAVNPAEALDTVRHHHASGVTPIAAAPKELVPAVTGTPEPSIALTDQTTLRLALSKDPTTLDPSRANDTISTDQIGNLFMGLTRIDIDTGQVLPSLATAWSASEDGLEWTFTLRQDIPWGQYNPQTGQAAQVIDFDGQPRSVNARDVVYGIQRALMSDNSSAPLLYIIKNAREINTNQTADGQPTLLIAEDIGVEAIDDRTVKFTLETPAAYLPALLAYPITYPLPKWAIDEWADLWTEPARINTSGPYLLHSWDRGQQITLIKNPLWVEADQIQIERLRQPIIPQAEDRLALYKNNELDLLEKLQDVEAVKADPALNAELEFYPLLCTTYLGFVHTKPPFNDVRIRRAFSAAIDREAIAALLDGGGIPATSLAPPGVFGAPAPGTVGQGYDPDLARESLQEFLDERGFTIEEFNDTYQITYGTSGQLSDFESAIMEMWADILGVEVTPNTLPWSEYKNVVEKNTPIESMYHIYQYTWYADYPDENNWVHELFNSEVGMNRLRRNCADPNCQETTGPTRFDELTIAAGQNNQPEERIKLYAEAEKILAVDEAAYAPIYHCARSALTKPWLNRTYPRLGAPNYWTWNVDVEKQQEGKNKQSE